MNDWYSTLCDNFKTELQEVGKVARFQAAPKEPHVLAGKRIFIYLKETTNLAFGIQNKMISIWFPT